jgi:Helix-turn-helix domain
MGYESSKSEIKPAASYDDLVSLIKQLQVALDRIVPPGGEMLTLEQAAKRLGISRRSIDRIISPNIHESKRLKTMRVGGRLKVRTIWLEAYLNRLTR